MTTSPAAPPQNDSPLVRLLRILLPGKLYGAVRAKVMNVFTPSMYARSFGYFRSGRAQTVVDASGQAAPWMTYPLIQFLERRSFEGRTVLEFGSGASSTWWGGRADRVVALETDPEWTDVVRAKAPSNVEVVAVPLEYAATEDFIADVHEVVGEDKFDVVVVDGGDRVKALHTVPSVITDDGVVIVDDLDLHLHLPAWIEALDALRAQGFGSIDFYGLASGAPFTRRERCTSIFFRDGSFITDRGPLASA